MNRRSFLATLGAAAAARVRGQTPAKPDFTLRIGPVSVEPKLRQGAEDNRLQRAAVPGPLIRCREGQTITIEAINESSVPELVHWHGVRCAPEVDGAMEEGTPMLAPGKSARYTFTASPSGTRWYHSHTMAGPTLNHALYTGQFRIFRYRYARRSRCLRSGDFSFAQGVGSVSVDDGRRGWFP